MADRKFPAKGIGAGVGGAVQPEKEDGAGDERLRRCGRAFK